MSFAVQRLQLAARGEIDTEDSSRPSVSILLPNLNNVKFLEQRFESILCQIYTNWELIVIDGYSEDGSWEMIQQYASADQRIVAVQHERQGIYAAINDCINLARGEFIYIATGDDTMSPDCLERMVVTLKANPDCDLCHCCLTIIDEEGKALESAWEGLPSSQFFGAYLSKMHVRIAPHDAILYCCLNTVYSSLTQLLIRRSIFSRVGLFRSDFGSQGDLEWGIRATLQCNTVHIPLPLATWRRHPNQASQDCIIDSPQAKVTLVEAVKNAIISGQNQNTKLKLKISLRQLTFCYRFQQLELLIWSQKGTYKKLMHTLNFFLLRPDVVIRFILDRASVKTFDRIQYAKKLLMKQGISQNLKPTK